MIIIKEAILGTGEAVSGGVIVGSGYKHDVGISPPNLDALITKPGGVSSWNKYLQKGWNGPYLQDDGTDNYKYDAWSMAYVLNDTQIVSYGSNKQSGGGDDLIIEY